jgi:hypothetical protein
MSSNPFEPPRTTDLDGGGSAVSDTASLSDEATRELIAATPWVRWLARLASVSIALGIIQTIVNLGGAEGASRRMGRLLGMVIWTVISIMILRALRRYAGASERLRAGAHQAVGQVIAAQASYFKLQGVLLIVAGSLGAIIVPLILIGLLLKR